MGRLLRIASWIALGCAVASMHLWPREVHYLYSAYLMVVTAGGAILSAAGAARSSGRNRLVLALMAVTLFLWSYAQISMGVGLLLTGAVGASRGRWGS